MAGPKNRSWEVSMEIPIRSGRAIPGNSSEVGKNWKNLRSILEVGPKDLGDGFEERYVSEFHFGQVNFEIT